MNFPENAGLYVISFVLAAVGAAMALSRGYSMKTFGALMLVGSGAMMVVGAVANALAGRLTAIDVVIVVVGAVIVLIISIKSQSFQDSFNRNVQNTSGGWQE